MKPILPTLREKNRYLLYQVISMKKLSYLQVKQAIEQSVLTYLGIFETAKSSFQVLPEWDNQQGLIKVNTKYTDKVRSALILISNINKVQAITKVKAVSGTIKGTRKFIGG